MTNEELKKYLQWMNNEYGDRGWEGQGQMSLDNYGSESLSGREGWRDILKDQLRTNQLGDNSPNYSFAEKTLPSNMGLLSSRADIDQVLGHELVDNTGQFPALDPRFGMRTDGAPVGPQLMSEQPWWDPQTMTLGDDPNLGFPSAFHAAEGEVPLGDPWATSSLLGPTSASATLEAPEHLSPLYASASPPLALSTSEAVAQAYPLDYTASGANLYGQTAESAAAVQAAEAGATAAETGTSAWGGPATFAGNMALNMIPTQDRNKVNTPLGDRGSMSGIVKGGGKGALTGATIGSLFPGPGTAIGAVVGGTLGTIGGAQGYFDSTSPPSIQISRIIRGRMPQGLLGGGSMYG